MKKKILLIEDDETIGDFMTVVLSKESYDVVSVKTGMAALTIIQQISFSLILLDLGLPDIDGLDLLKILKKQVASAIIVVSARDNEVGKVAALDLGADDYVTKPFGTQELLARIRASLRHQVSSKLENAIIENGDLKIDREKHQLYKGGKEIHLTKNEFRLVERLFESLGKVVTHDQLMKLVWGGYSQDQRILRVNMSNIRKKIEEIPIMPTFILTEVGVGYRMKDHREEENQIT